MSLEFTRRQYAEMFGPTVGDQVRLADTELFIEIEKDLVAEAGGYGNEVKFGGGKVIRDGMGQSPLALDADCLDLVLTNATIIDPILGIIKADIGVKDGRIAGIGHVQLLRDVDSEFNVIGLDVLGGFTDRPWPEAGPGSVGHSAIEGNTVDHPVEGVRVDGAGGTLLEHGESTEGRHTCKSGSTS